MILSLDYWGILIIKILGSRHIEETAIYVSILKESIEILTIRQLPIILILLIKILGEIITILTMLKNMLKYLEMIKTK
jgi:hypothetical protein